MDAVTSKKVKVKRKSRGKYMLKPLGAAKVYSKVNQKKNSFFLLSSL